MLVEKKGEKHQILGRVFEASSRVIFTITLTKHTDRLTAS